MFELRLDKFVNELNRDAVGKCCGGYSSNSVDMPGSGNATTSAAATRNGREMCQEECHIFFRVCFLNYQSNMDKINKFKCHYGDKTTSVLTSTSSSDSATKSYNYTIKFPFDFSWPVS